MITVPTRTLAHSLIHPTFRFKRKKNENVRFVKAGDDPMYSSQYQEISEAQAVSIIQTVEKRSVGVSTG